MFINNETASYVTKIRKEFLSEFVFVDWRILSAPLHTSYFDTHCKSWYSTPIQLCSLCLYETYHDICPWVLWVTTLYHVSTLCLWNYLVFTKAFWEHSWYLLHFRYTSMVQKVACIYHGIGICLAHCTKGEHVGLFVGVLVLTIMLQLSFIDSHVFWRGLKKLEVNVASTCSHSCIPIGKHCPKPYSSLSIMMSVYTTLSSKELTCPVIM